MTKKDFPRFSDAKFQFEVSQPQMKLILCAVSAFRKLLDTDTCIEQLKSIIENPEWNHGFKFKSHSASSRKTFKNF